MKQSSNSFPATITAIIQTTPRIKIFRIHYGMRSFDFKPGQWIDLYAPIEGKNIGGYTIISSPNDKGFIELAIRDSTTHPVTKYMHEVAKVGTVVKITEGQGHFFLTDNIQQDGRPIIFIAGGIGITPILSMLRWVRSKNLPYKLFYSVSNEEDILLRDELGSDAYFTATKSTSSTWAGEKKRLSVEFVKEKINDMNCIYYICGPKEMIDQFSRGLKESGLKSEDVHFEKWW